MLASRSGMMPRKMAGYARRWRPTESSVTGRRPAASCAVFRGLEGDACPCPLPALLTLGTALSSNSSRACSPCSWKSSGSPARPVHLFIEHSPSTCHGLRHLSVCRTQRNYRKHLISDQARDWGGTFGWPSPHTPTPVLSCARLHVRSCGLSTAPGQPALARGGWGWSARGMGWSAPQERPADTVQGSCGPEILMRHIGSRWPGWCSRDGGPRGAQGDSGLSLPPLPCCGSGWSQEEALPHLSSSAQGLAAGETGQLTSISSAPSRGQWQ